MNENTVPQRCSSVADPAAKGYKTKRLHHSTLATVEQTHRYNPTVRGAV